MSKKKNLLIACVMFFSLFLTSTSLAATLGTDSGNITISSTTPVAALEVFGKNKTNGIAAIMGSGSGAKLLYFPHFAADKHWWSGLAVANLSATPSTGLP